jgi:hypothetical protein
VNEITIKISDEIREKIQTFAETHAIDFEEAASLMLEIITASLLDSQDKFADIDKEFDKAKQEMIGVEARKPDFLRHSVYR